jgi:hypothetical protein
MNLNDKKAQNFISAEKKAGIQLKIKKIDEKIKKNKSALAKLIMEKEILQNQL